MANCRSCNAALTWAITENGKRMPFDAEPVRGLFMIDKVGPDTIARSAGALYRSHFASCPNADQHRKGRE